MQTAQTDSNHRIFFFDNLRYFLVLLVVLLHSTGSYSNLSNWWAVDDDNFSFFDSLVIFLDSFLMPGLFFIAGYFALHSHQGQTTWEFIKKKLFHLGIPWLIGVILTNPVQMYIYKLSRNIDDVTFFQCFSAKMKSASSFHIGIVNHSELYNQFHQYHFWFVSLLLFFFIIFALLRKIKNGVFSKPTIAEKSDPPSNFSILIAISIAGVLFVFSSLVIHGVFPKATMPNTWFVVANILQFQVSKIALYVICFSLGIFAYHKNWFSNNQAPGHMLIWGALSAVCFVCIHEIIFAFMKEISLNLAIAYLFLFPIFFFSILLFLISAGIKYWNNSSKTNRLLADNSYNIYLIHMVFVYLFQLAMLQLAVVPVYLKAIMVWALSIGVSLLISKYALKRSRSLSVAGMVGIFVALLVI